jgi:hypothetical protein
MFVLTTIKGGIDEKIRYLDFVCLSIHGLN